MHGSLGGCTTDRTRDRRGSLTYRPSGILWTGPGPSCRRRRIRFSTFFVTLAGRCRVRESARGFDKPRERNGTVIRMHTCTRIQTSLNTRAASVTKVRGGTPVCGQPPTTNTVNAGSNSSSSQSTTACRVYIQGVPHRSLISENQKCVHFSAVGGTRFENIGFYMYRNAFQSDFFIIIIM